ncbi:MAG: hypothetical protein PHF76_12460 [Bacteroidales bacterium]|nr:hypothetical protein [Bacteroidales bacterium]
MDFSNNNVYMLFAIARSKANNGITAKQQVVIREPVRSLESYPHKLEKIKSAAKLRDLKFYIYVSVNARDTKKAYVNFKKKLSDYELQAMFGQEEYKYQLSRLHKVWYSSLMQPNTRATKYFVVDVDTKNQEVLNKVIDTIENFDCKGYTARVFHVKETRNGYHVVTSGFDKKVLSGIPDVSVQSDTLLYLDCIGFE